MTAREFFETLEARAEPGRIRGIDHSYLFDIDGEGQWLVEVRGESIRVTEGAADADVTITVGSEIFERIASGRQNPMAAYMTGKLKVSGDTAAALKLQKLF